MKSFTLFLKKPGVYLPFLLFWVTLGNDPHSVPRRWTHRALFINTRNPRLYNIWIQCEGLLFQPGTASSNEARRARWQMKTRRRTTLHKAPRLRGSAGRLGEIPANSSLTSDKSHYLFCQVWHFDETPSVWGAERSPELQPSIPKHFRLLNFDWGECLYSGRPSGRVPTPTQMKPFTHATSPFHTFPRGCGSCSSPVRGFRAWPAKMEARVGHPWLRFLLLALFSRSVTKKHSN